MADNVFWSAIYLGNFADMDTNESTAEVEDASALLTTFGTGPGNALSNNIVTIDTDAGFGDTSVTTNNDAGSNDTLTYDLGAGSVTSEMDSVMLLNGTVTFHDGSTFSSNFAVMQDDIGNVFMIVLDSQSELVSDGIDSVTFTSVTGSNYSGVTQANADDHDFVCFGPGTLLQTPDGAVRADKLRLGDQLLTLDNGPQPIRWIAKQRLNFAGGQHPAQPIRLRKNALGKALPQRDLLLSPNHRLLVKTAPSFALHDPLGALAPIKALTRTKGIRALPGRRHITYFNFLLPRHEVIIAEGIAVESLFPGPGVFAQLDGRARTKWLKLAARGDRLSGNAPARLMLTTAEARSGLDTKALTLPDTAPILQNPNKTRRFQRPLPLHLRKHPIKKSA
ncbi:MAG: Hint domain-containing protein [Maritimibacter sp.]